MSKADPYVLISVPGVNFKPIKTKSIKSTQEPVWNETHTFDVSFLDFLYSFFKLSSFLMFNYLWQINDVAGKTFILQVFDKDMMKDDGLGEVGEMLSSEEKIF